MPVADTELIFGLNPEDRRHAAVNACLARNAGIVIPDTALVEFCDVLRSRGRRPVQVRGGIEALLAELDRRGLEEVGTISGALLADALHIEESRGLSYYDAMIAASARVVDAVVVSDDRAFDRVEGLERMPISGRTRRRASQGGEDA